MNIAYFFKEEWEKKYLETHPDFQALIPSTRFIRGACSKESAEACKDAEILSVFVDSVLDGETLARMPLLKHIAARSTGIDHIDGAYCRTKGITISSVPSYGEYTVAEYTFALLLCLSRKIYDAYDRIRETGKFSQEGLRGFDLKGKTLGVVGCGKIGRHVASIARRFEMNVLIADPASASQEFAREIGGQVVPFEDLLGQSDIVTLHVPYADSTHHLVNERTIGLMKRGAYLINTSRGGVVETGALVKALKDGQIGGAGLDVLEEEGAIRDELDILIRGNEHEYDLKTVLANHILFDMPNVVITPHNAFNTAEALQRIVDTTVQNIRAFIAGTPLNLVQ
ncbi:MAG: hydroxyacid dehydrogenase [Candidatus Wildermuthbacteria bacterium]|nr:hydroxyacid dehydrogenase [Candidatus Wildermuthbacteria bacterium]